MLAWCYISLHFDNFMLVQECISALISLVALHLEFEALMIYLEVKSFLTLPQFQYFLCYLLFTVWQLKTTKSYTELLLSRSRRIVLKYPRATTWFPRPFPFFQARERVLGTRMPRASALGLSCHKLPDRDNVNSKPNLSQNPEINLVGQSKFTQEHIIFKN